MHFTYNGPTAAAKLLRLTEQTRRTMPAIIQGHRAYYSSAFATFQNARQVQGMLWRCSVSNKLTPYFAGISSWIELTDIHFIPVKPPVTSTSRDARSGQRGVADMSTFVAFRLRMLKLDV